MNRNILLLLAAGVLALGIFLQSPESQSPADALINSGAQDSAHFHLYMQNAQARSFNSSGTLNYSLSTELATHHPDLKPTTIEFKRPYLKVYQADQASNASAWSIKADSGRAVSSPETPNTDVDTKSILEADTVTKVLLEGDVVLNYEYDDGHYFKLNTATLTVETKAKRASTNAKVTLWSEAGEIQGYGMEADLTKGTFLLRSDDRGRVRSRYQFDEAKSDAG